MFASAILDDVTFASAIFVVVTESADNLSEVILASVIFIVVTAFVESSLVPTAPASICALDVVPDKSPPRVIDEGLSNDKTPLPLVDRSCPAIPSVTLSSEIPTVSTPICALDIVPVKSPPTEAPAKSIEEKERLPLLSVVNICPLATLEETLSSVIPILFSKLTLSKSSLAKGNPPTVVPSCTTMVSLSVSCVISPSAPVNILCSAVVPLRLCTSLAILFS